MIEHLSETSEHGIPATRTRLNAWFYFDDECGAWVGIAPELDGARVESTSVSAARNDLSILIGRIVHSHESNRKRPPWIESPRFDPPDGAIQRIFNVRR